MNWLLWIGILLFVVYLVQSIYLAVVLRWEDEQTVGVNYYGRSPEGRAAFKAQLARHARFLAPILWLNSRLAKVDFRRARVVVRDTSFPHGTCSEESVSNALAFQPTGGDIFVATQMKCGTTWMQHVVYQVLYRGAGDLVETGKAMYAVAPWLEGRKSVSLTDAPRHGASHSRIIKTHLPATLCPWSAEAKYIYVARHPLSCYASCVDFVATNVGAMAPPAPQFEEWYQSPDLMWWGTWPDHIKGWWKKSQTSPNVLFVFFEDMKKDLPGVTRRVAEFLGVPPLTESELAAAVHKCGFAYMQEHQDNFEMHPPHVLQTNAELFVRGTADRHKDVPADARTRLARWCAAEMAASDFPLATSYPDVIGQ